MSSIHIHRAMRKATELGGYAGRTETQDLWSLPKREMVEIALRLAEQCADEGGFDSALKRVWEEHQILASQGII